MLLIHDLLFLLFIKRYLMSLNVIEPIKSAIKEFHSVEEFNVYYQLHKEEIDNTTTHKLNKMYHIDGYRITKIKNVLMLKRAPDSTKEMNVQEEISTIKDTLNKIIKFLNTGEQPDE